MLTMPRDDTPKGKVLTVVTARSGGSGVVSLVCHVEPDEPAEPVELTGTCTVLRLSL
jgi:hypothetical protein